MNIRHIDAIDIEKIQADPDEMLNKILDNMKLEARQKIRSLRVCQLMI
ncbi:MAG: hypothetical protein ACLS9K_02435 [Lachnospira eligens]